MEDNVTTDQPTCPICGALCQNDIAFARASLAYGMERFRLFCTNGHSNYIPPLVIDEDTRRMRYQHRFRHTIKREKNEKADASAS